MNKKYYTAFIPFNLADLLDSAGMEHVEFNSTTYAEAFDFFMNRGLEVEFKPYYYVDGRLTFFVCIGLIEKEQTLFHSIESFGYDYGTYDTWHEAANAAIEAALEILEKQSKTKNNEKEKQD